MAFNERSLDDYIDVAQRIADFRERYPEGCLQPLDLAKPWEQAVVQGYDKQGKQFAATMIVYVAAAYRTPDDQRPGVGVAWEAFPGRTPYTLGSELMNAETSAWGRAIVAVLASDSKAGVASRQEVKARRAEREDGLPVNADGSLSRSRTDDAQKAAAGVMTDGQAKEHNALRRSAPGGGTAEKLVAVPADDPFYDSESPSEVLSQDTPGTIARPQSRTMHARFAELGIKDRGERLEYTVAVIGRPVSSSSELSYREAGLVLEALAAPPARSPR
jgi:hypothetical protein